MTFTYIRYSTYDTVYDTWYSITAGALCIIEWQIINSGTENKRNYKILWDLQIFWEWSWRANVRQPILPVWALEAYMQGFGPWDGPLFQHGDGSPLMLYQFCSVFNRALWSLGLPPGDYGLHSFRIGAATTGLPLGMPMEVIRRIGCWWSEAYKLYVHKY